MLTNLLTCFDGMADILLQRNASRGNPELAQAGLQARYLRLTDMMLAYGPDLGMPHTRPLGGGLFEIRAKSKEGIGRVMYGTLPGERIVMLHAFIKKTQATPKKELEIAVRRLKQVKSNAKP